MMSFKAIAGTLLTVTVMSATAAQAMVDRVAVVLKTPVRISAGMTMVEFDLQDQMSGKNLGDTDLDISNEKKLHFIAYDEALVEFQHVHPQFDGKTWHVDMEFPVNGNYKLWAQGKIASDGEEFSSKAGLEIFGGANAWPKSVMMDTRSGSADTSTVTLSGDRLRAGKMTMLMMDFSRTDGTTPVITPYLGAMAHIIATPEDGETLVHVHAMDSSATQGMLHVTFPKAGTYRLWIQFIDGDPSGPVKVVPLSVVVTN